MAQTPQAAVDFESAADLDTLYGLLDRVQMKNGWAKAVPVIVPQPKKTYVPAHWRYADAHAALHVAGRLVATEWAERRNLIMANPIEGNEYGTVPTLVGAYQMVKAGEVAHSHRHTPNAMRIVVDAGPDTYTIVDGTKIPMLRGDVLLTPNWCYHGHANESAQDAYWIDFLDSPLVDLIGPMFFQKHPERVERAQQVDADSPMRFAYADYQPRLLASPEIAAGVRSLVLGPATLPTFDRVAVALAAGARWSCPRSTANQVFTVIEGEGESTIGDKTFRWAAGDMIAAPGWHDQRHAASADAVLLRVSDEPLMRMLGWFHTEESAKAQTAA
jgi:gentisate 1,2-dioxygenase